jgi:hypothetical protein
MDLVRISKAACAETRLPPRSCRCALATRPKPPMRGRVGVEQVRLRTAAKRRTQGACRANRACSGGEAHLAGAAGLADCQQGQNKQS